MLRVFLARNTSLLVYIKTVKRIPGINWASTVLIYFWLSFKSQVTLLLTRYASAYISYLLIRLYLVGQSQATAVLAVCVCVLLACFSSLLRSALAPVRV